MSMTPLHRSIRMGTTMLAAGTLITIAMLGCGESTPPTLSKEEFDSAKSKREEIIAKEYGSKAVERANAPKKKKH